MSIIAPEVISQFHDKLRNEYRIKQGTDYSLTYKYSELHLLCGDVYRDTIMEVAAEFGLAFKTTHTY